MQSIVDNRPSIFGSHQFKYEAHTERTHTRNRLMPQNPIYSYNHMMCYRRAIRGNSYQYTYGPLALRVWAVSVQAPKLLRLMYDYFSVYSKSMRRLH